MPIISGVHVVFSVNFIAYAYKIYRQNVVGIQLIMYIITPVDL